MMQRLYSPRLFRFCAVVILVFCALYLLSAVGAYFAFSLHTNSLQNSYDWWYASDNYWRFMSRQLPIRWVVAIVYMLILPTILVFGSVLGLNVVMRWQALTLHERRLAKIVFSAVILTLLSWLTPLWSMGGLWFYD
jgi:hypothetical protein